MIDMDKMFKVAAQIQDAYKADRYVDIDGNVWLGRGDERWYMEDKGHLEDPAYWLTEAQMRKKMINELMDYEQERRDAAVRIEALYEYSVRYTLKGKTLPVGHWMSKEEAEAWLTDGGTSGENAEFGPWSKALVRRRKAGPVEVVDA